MKATITTTTTVVPENETLGQKERTLYYLIIETEKGKRVINVGDKTYKEINALEPDKEPSKPNVKPIK